MAQPVTSVPVDLGSWEARSTSVGAVLCALDELRHASPRTATRTAVVNLVVVVADEAERQRAHEGLHALGRPHPGRTLVLLPDSDAPPGLDASVILHGGESSGHQVWSEDVELRVGGGAASHLDSLIEPLTFPDLPVVVWWVGTAPSPEDRLVAAADAIVVDTKEASDPHELADLAALARRHTVLDLSWIRLTPWRELLAGLLDGPEWLPHATAVVSAEVHGKPGPRRLLGGWLRSRLDLPAARLHLSDARHVSMRLVTEAGGRRGRFSVERAGDGRLLRAAAAIEGGPSASEVLALPDVTLPWSLGQAMTHLRRDRVYDDALRAAVALAP